MKPTTNRRLRNPSALPRTSPAHRARLRLATPRPRSIVVAVSFDDASVIALRRAHTLARAWDHDLVVVHVIPPFVDADSPSYPRSPQIAALLATPNRVRVSANAIQRWARFETGLALPRESIVIGVGDPVPEIVRVAEELDASLVVVGGRASSDDPQPGPIVNGIVDTARRSVLVASTPRADGPIVVGTDLVRDDLPVVGHAWDLARRLGAKLAVVHNVARCWWPLPRGPIPLPSTVLAQLEATRLAAATANSAWVARLTDESSPSDGILDVARALDADVVVVGTTAGGGGTSHALINAARRSVLAVSLERDRACGAHSTC